jgi:hypothetical protein
MGIAITTIGGGFFPAILAGAKVREKKTDMRPFFITGLPRCRTAWLANYLSYGDTICLHDMAHHLTFAEIEDIQRKSGCSNVGYADPALLLRWRTLIDDVPKARWLVVERDPEDVARTWDDVLGQDSRMELLAYQNELEGLKRTAGGVLTVAFDDINTRLGEIERHLAPGFQCPQWRRDMLTRLNVQKTARMIRQEMESLWV